MRGSSGGVQIAAGPAARPNKTKRASMRENGEEKKKREVIYNGLSAFETTCTRLAGEKGARRKFGKEQPLGQSDIVVQWKGKCSHKSRPRSCKRSINWEAFSTCCDVSVEVTLLSAGGRGHGVTE